MYTAIDQVQKNVKEYVKNENAVLLGRYLIDKLLVLTF